MDDPKTLWLSAVNIVLGLLVLICFLPVISGVLHEIVLRLKRRTNAPHIGREADVHSSEY
jgi:hypothetical protein